VWTNTLPAVGFQDQSLEKQTHHEPDFARNEFSPKKAMKSKQLSRAFR
jgi:hypothetical protein